MRGPANWLGRMYPVARVNCPRLTLGARMAFADPKWLEILKASAGQSAAAALACGLLLLVARWGWVPPLDPWMIIATTFGLLLFGFLTLASFFTAINKIFPVREWISVLRQ